LIGAAPALVPAVVGSRWRDATLVMPAAGLAVMIYGPVGVAASGYLWASGDARTPLRAHGLESIVWCAAGLALLPIVGISALGIGWLAGAVVFALVLDRSTRRLLGARLLATLAAPLAVAVAAGAAGWVAARSGSPTLSWAIAVAALSETVFLGGLLIVRRVLLFQIIGMFWLSVRVSLSRSVRAERRLRASARS
jgi:hypothetical protein